MFALQWIGFAHDSGFGDRRVMQNCAFDLEWSDAVSGALDDIVGPPLEPEVSRLVASREIACGDPSVPKKCTRTLLAFPIAQRVVALLARALRQMAQFAGGSSRPSSSMMDISNPGIGRPIAPGFTSESSPLKLPSGSPFSLEPK